WLDGGKGLSNWDGYSHTPGLIANGDTGDVANDMYHLYPSDIKLMKEYGLRHYRFSISWNRIMPTGIAPVSEEALLYYNDLIDQLLEHDIEPHVTIFHNDIPLALSTYPNNPMPFLDSERFPGWFGDYAEVLFQSFGDRVKQWFTFNEPFCTAVYGTYGDQDPYMIAHNAILAHATAVKIYRDSYQSRQGGTIGIVLNTAHFYPNNPSSMLDIASAERGYDFWYGWFMSPLTSGEYPLSMRHQVGSRLPGFTSEQRALIKGSLDFVALNYYFPYMTSPGTFTDEDPPSYFKDMNLTTTFNSSWPLSQTGWGIYGPGLRDLLVYSSKRYPEVPLYITENGLAWEEPTVADAVNDTMRQQYLHDHIEAVGQALDKGCDVRGYFVWSFQ
ncbi:BGLU30, partial [Symbiodinium microadriaticum]